MQDKDILVSKSIVRLYETCKRHNKEKLHFIINASAKIKSCYTSWSKWGEHKI